MYTARSFISWYINSAKGFKGNIFDMSVGRVNHSKNYCFGNIELVSRSENAREMITRVINPNFYRQRPVVAYNAKTMIKIAEFESMALAGKAFGVAKSHVLSMCNGRAPNGRRYKQTKSGYTFRFLRND